MLELYLNLRSTWIYFVVLVLDFALELTAFGRDYTCLGEKCLSHSVSPEALRMVRAGEQTASNPVLGRTTFISQQ